jgi:hypothetical protein
MVFNGTVETAVLVILGVLGWACLFMMILNVINRWYDTENVSSRWEAEQRRRMQDEMKRHIRVASWTAGPKVDEIEFETSLASEPRRQSQSLTMQDSIV